MTYCTKCGKQLPETGAFCMFCGQPVKGKSDQTQHFRQESAAAPAAGYCRHCGSALSGGALFCRSCGKPVPAVKKQPAASVRCPGCGGAVVLGRETCPACGSRALSREEYRELIEKARAFGQQRIKIAPWPYILIGIAALVLLFLLVASLNLYPDERMTADIVLSFTVIPALVALWAVMRRFYFKRLGADSKTYRKTAAEYGKLPPAFFRPLPEDPEPGVPSHTPRIDYTPQSVRRSRIFAFAMIPVVALIAGTVIYFAVNGTDEVGLNLFDVNAYDSTDTQADAEENWGTLSGRWKNMTYVQEKEMTEYGEVQEITTPTMLFEGNKVYFGADLDSDESVIYQSTMMNGEMTYKAGNGKIIFTKENGETYTYTFENSTIYMDDGEYRRID